MANDTEVWVRQHIVLFNVKTGKPLDLTGARIRVTNTMPGTIEIRYGEDEFPSEEGDFCPWCGASEEKCKNCGGPKSTA